VLMGSISILIAFMAAAELVGVSVVIGAFAAGVAIRNDETKALAVKNGIDSIRAFFVAIFFVTVGALVSFPTLEMAVIAGALIALVLLVNPVVLMLSFIYEGYDTRTAFFAGAGLNQVSEFSLIIAIQAALVTDTIADSMFDAIILAAAVTMIATAFIRRYEEPLYAATVPRFFDEQRTDHVDANSRVDEGFEDHVIILGYGRQGRRLVETLEDLGQPYVVIENDPALQSRLETECAQFVFGDAMSTYPWEKAGSDTAGLVISTVDHEPVSRAILDLDTAADLVLRTSNVETAEDFLEAGATYVSVPNILAGEQLLEVVEGLLEEDTSGEALREQHLDQLLELERYGFASQRERY